jgi:hypothetical protein
VSSSPVACPSSVCCELLKSARYNVPSVKKRPQRLEFAALMIAQSHSHINKHNKEAASRTQSENITNKKKAETKEKEQRSLPPTQIQQQSCQHTGTATGTQTSPACTDTMPAHRASAQLHNALRDALAWAFFPMSQHRTLSGSWAKLWERGA